MTEEVKGFSKYVTGLSKITGIPKEKIKQIQLVKNWRKAMKSYWDNPIPFLEAGIEKRRKLIEKYNRLIKKHEKSISRLERLIEKYKGEV